MFSGNRNETKRTVLRGTFALILMTAFLVLSIFTYAADHDVAAVSCGRHYTAILKKDGTLWMCGANNSGQLGDGTTEDRNTPVQVMSEVAAVSCGTEHTAILKKDGTLWMCGANDYGQLGNGKSGPGEREASPVQVMSNVEAVNTGSNHTMVLTKDGALWAFGDNQFCQLGIGDTIPGCSSPTQIQGMTNVASVSSGERHTAILKTDGTLWMCGFNYPVPVQIPDMDNVISVTCKDFQTAIIKADGSLWMCVDVGDGGDGGEVGDPSGVGDGGDAGDPSGAGDTGVIGDSGDGGDGEDTGDAGEGGDAGGVDDGGAIGGTGDAGGVGDGGAIGGTGDAGDGENAGGAGDGDDAGAVGGAGDAGGVGDVGDAGDSGGSGDTGNDKYHFVPIPGMTNVMKVICTDTHTAIVKKDGTLWMYGNNDYGQLGNGHFGYGNESTPIEVMAGVKDVSAGRYHTAILKADGTLWMCGDNHYGQLGDGTKEDRSTPVQVHFKPNLPEFSLSYSDKNNYRNISLSFESKPVGIDEVEVRYYKNNDSAAEKTKVFKLSETSGKPLTLTKLSNGKSYQVMARAISGSETGEWSEVKTIVIPANLLVSDFWGFKNQRSVDMIHHYEKFMGHAKAQELGNTSGGLCYGLAVTGLASLMLDYPSPDAWNVDLLSGISGTAAYNEKVSMSFLDLVQYGYAIQKLPAVMEMDFSKDPNDLAYIYNSVKEGIPLMLTMYKMDSESGRQIERSRRHTIVALDVYKETDSQVKIRCYDPNSPLSVNRFLVLYKNSTSGGYSKWDFSFGAVFSGTLINANLMTTSQGKHYVKQEYFAQSDNDLIFINEKSPDYFKQEMTKPGNYTRCENYSLLHLDLTLKQMANIPGIINKAPAEWELVNINKGTAGFDDIFFWTKNKTVTLASLPAGTALTLASDHHSAKVTVSRKSNVTINVENSGKMSVIVKPAANGAVTVEMKDFSSTSADVETKTVKVTGTKGTAIRIDKSSDIKIKGVSSFTITQQNGQEGRDGNITYTSKVSATAKKTEIKRTYKSGPASDGKITIKTSSKSNGVFDIVYTNAASTLKKGTKKTVGKLKYKVMSVSGRTGTASVIGPKSKAEKALSIPATIKISGITLKVSSIGKNAFIGCGKLTKIVIGKNVTSVGTNAFYGCKALTKVTIGKGVKTIGAGAFRGCVNLTSISIPAKVAIIGKNAFYGDRKLKTIKILTGKLTSKNVGANAFKGIRANAVIRVPKMKLTVYRKFLKTKGIGKKVKIA